MNKRGILKQIAYLICIFASFTLSSCNPFADGQTEEVEHWTFSSFEPVSTPTDNSVYVNFRYENYYADTANIYTTNGPCLHIKANNLKNVYGASFEITYDTANIYVTDIKEGDFFKQGLIDTKFSAKYKEQPGKISIEIFRSDSTNISGNGILATIRIDSRSGYSRQLTTTTIGFNSNSSIIPSDQNIETKWLGGNLIWSRHFDTQSK